MARKKTKAYPESFRKEAVRLADMPDRTESKGTDLINRVREQYSLIL